MYLKHKCKDYRKCVGFGQLFLAVGFLSGLVSWLGIPEIAGMWSVRESLVHFTQGLTAGLSIPLLGASIYMNARGLVLYRKKRV